jgi:putative membrane protein
VERRSSGARRARAEVQDAGGRRTRIAVLAWSTAARKKLHRGFPLPNGLGFVQLAPVPVLHRDDRLALVLLTSVLAGVVVAGISPHDFGVFLLEVVPWLTLLALVAAFHRRYPMTPLSHLAIAGLCALFVIGAHYTYSRVPFGLWLRDALELRRNPYDRAVHFAGGFVGGLLVREAVLRRTRLVRGGRTFAIVSLVCLAGAALYEILEWWIAVAVGKGASQFLAMQGDEWDTQWDMFLALLGAVLAQTLLGRVQDRQMRVRGIKRDP